MSEEEVDELMKKPIEQVKAESLNELKDYAEDIEQVGFDGVVDLINKQIETENDRN